MGEDDLVNEDPDMGQWIEELFNPISALSGFDERPRVVQVGKNPPLALAFMHKLFADPWPYVERFTPDQIGNGFYYLVSNGESDYSFTFLDHSLPLERRVACLHDIARVYGQLFAKVCVDGVPETSQCDFLADMWWDVFPMFPRSKLDFSRYDSDVIAHPGDHTAIERACLTAMEHSLNIDHPACVKGALHGLGHWHNGYPEVVEAAIDRFLNSRRPLSSRFRDYALQARTGMVL
jgi:hypothetical protein